MGHMLSAPASLIHLLAFTALPAKICRFQSCTGISRKSQLLFGLVYVTRWLSHKFVWEDFLCLCCAMGTLYLMFLPFRATCDRHNDSLRIIPLIAPVVLLTVLISTISEDFSDEVFWRFSHYLEAVAILPQFYMSYKMNQEMDQFMFEYLLALVFNSWFRVYGTLWDNVSTQSSNQVTIPSTIDATIVYAGLCQSAVYCILPYLYFRIIPSIEQQVPSIAKTILLKTPPKTPSHNDLRYNINVDKRFVIIAPIHKNF